MRIVEVEGLVARCAARGVERSVSLWLLQHETLAPGDHVMVHRGQGMQKLSAAEAQSAWDLFDEMLEAEQQNRPRS